MTAATDRTAQNGHRSVKFHWLAHAMELWTNELCAAYGFRHDCWRDEGEVRVIELLGPDSPSEFVIRFPKWRLTDQHFQSLVRDVVLAVDQAGYRYTGRYAPGIVPDEYRPALTAKDLHAWQTPSTSRRRR